MPAIVGLHLYVWNRKVLRADVWKVLAFVCVAWDILNNFLISPAVSGEWPGLETFLGLLLFAPLYIALFRYAYGTWPE